VVVVATAISVLAEVTLVTVPVEAAEQEGLPLASKDRSWLVQLKVAMPLPVASPTNILLAPAATPKSFKTRLRKVGAAATPEEGPAKTKFAFWFARLSAGVVVEVATLKIPAGAALKLVTVPAEAADQVALVPSVCKTLPVFPVCVGSRAFSAAVAVVCPVPPFEIGTAADK
jgi:hypothetical protein